MKNSQYLWRLGSKLEDKDLQQITMAIGLEMPSALPWGDEGLYTWWLPNHSVELLFSPETGVVEASSLTWKPFIAAEIRLTNDSLVFVGTTESDDFHPQLEITPGKVVYQLSSTSFEGWLSSKVAAARLECTLANVQHLAKRGHLSGRKVGRKLQIDADSLAAYEASGLRRRKKDASSKPSQPVSPADALSVADAAQFLGRPVGHVRSLIRKGVLTVIQDGDAHWIERESLDREIRTRRRTIRHLSG